MRRERNGTRSRSPIRGTRSDVGPRAILLRWTTGRESLTRPASPRDDEPPGPSRPSAAPVHTRPFPIAASADAGTRNTMQQQQQLDTHAEIFGGDVTVHEGRVDVK